MIEYKEWRYNLMMIRDNKSQQEFDCSEIVQKIVSDFEILFIEIQLEFWLNNLPNTFYEVLFSDISVGEILWEVEAGWGGHIHKRK